MNSPILPHSPVTARLPSGARCEVPLSGAPAGGTIPMTSTNFTPAANPVLSNKSENDAVSPFVVGVSGHRDLRADDWPHLRAAVTAILSELAEHLPDSELRITAGMA